MWILYMNSKYTYDSLGAIFFTVASVVVRIMACKDVYVLIPGTYGYVTFHG